MYRKFLAKDTGETVFEHNKLLKIETAKIEESLKIIKGILDSLNVDANPLKVTK